LHAQDPPAIDRGELIHMVWQILLAHFIGDFVLQTDWMIRQKQKPGVLTLHVSIHFGVMLLLAGQLRSAIWPYLLLIALVHLVQDILKILLTNRRPHLAIHYFILDQVMHYFIIWGVITWFHLMNDHISSPEKPFWIIVSLAYLLVTYVWFISERFINLSNAEYVKNINETKFSRMLARFGLLSLFLLVRGWVLPGLAFIIPTPYPTSKYQQRALLTDLSVSVLSMLFLLWALG
jgi:hypothetical protein